MSTGTICPVLTIDGGWILECVVWWLSLGVRYDCRAKWQPGMVYDFIYKLDCWLIQESFLSHLTV